MYSDDRHEHDNHRNSPRSHDINDRRDSRKSSTSHQLTRHAAYSSDSGSDRSAHSNCGDDRSASEDYDADRSTP